MTMQRIDHVGIVVNDLAAATEFFIDLGLEVHGEGELEGQWLDQIVGLNTVKTAYVFLGAAGSQASIELIKFYSPTDEMGIQQSAANTLGIRHVAFVVDDIEAVVAKLKTKGSELIGEVTRYENSFKLCYLRGPEGIILELAEEMK